MEWGLSGLYALAPHAAAVVIVDVLSFSTAVDVAVARDAAVLPFGFDHVDAARQAAFRAGAVLAGRRGEPGCAFTLSPASLQQIPAGTRLMLPSPNGSRLALAASRASPGRPVLTACFRNAPAVAAWARTVAGSGPVAVIPAGESWADGSLRPAIEDLLGAGAVICHLQEPCSPEAQVARDAYCNAGTEIEFLIRSSVSGRELSDRGFSGDLDLALEENVNASAPMIIDDAFHRA